MPDDDIQKLQADKVPCCPDLETEEGRCDSLTFDYRFVHTGGEVPVEVILRARLERCPGPLALGDLVHSTTLLPGERVRLYTANRRNRFTFDRESEVSYRHEQTSEETYLMSSITKQLSDLTVNQGGKSSLQAQSSFDTDGSVSGAIETFFVGPSADASGEFNAETIFEFGRELTSHAEASTTRSVEATRAANSVSIGEVQSRSHAEGESESAYEAATRTIANPNRCRAITFFSYQINKTQIVRFRVESIRRRVMDPAADTKVTSNPPRFAGSVSVIPQGVLATAGDRVAVESVGRASIAAQRANLVAPLAAGGGLPAGLAVSGGLQAQPVDRLLGREVLLTGATQRARPMAAEVRAKALEVVDNDLVAAGLMTRSGALTAEARRELRFEMRTSLPTAGILVKGCLDECSVCEPELAREIELELEKKALENRLLARRVELLEQSQEYRCCPAGEIRDEGDASGD